jgi:hypothetical protein
MVVKPLDWASLYDDRYQLSYSATLEYNEKGSPWS